MADDKSVQSIDRAIDIIEAVAVKEEGRSLTDISDTVGLHKSTAYRIIMTLVNRGYLEKNREGNYRIGYRLIETTGYYINNLELLTEARPYIAEINTHLGLASYLGVLDGDQVVYADKITAPSASRLYSIKRTRVNAYCSSLGKCILANYSNSELEDIMKDCSFIKFTPNTISDMEQLRAELAKVRKQGWAMEDEEYETGQRCIGAPVYDYKGDIVAAISASGEKHVLTDDRINEVADYLVKKAFELSKALGYVE